MELAGVPGRIPLYSPRKSPLSHGSKEIQHWLERAQAGWHEDMKMEKDGIRNHFPN
jgi:hypothetical protein